MKVYPQDLRLGGYCVNGCRRFARRYGLDWRKFVREGIDAAELEATGDAAAIDLVRKVNGRF